jgi:hypothetical protein
MRNLQFVEKVTKENIANHILSLADQLSKFTDVPDMAKAHLLLVEAYIRFMKTKGYLSAVRDERHGIALVDVKALKRVMDTDEEITLRIKEANYLVSKGESPKGIVDLTLSLSQLIKKRGGMKRPKKTTERAR